MKKYIGSFEWENGSINDNIRKILRDLHIGYYNTFNGDIVTSEKRKVIAEHETSNKYNVYIIF